MFSSLTGNRWVIAYWRNPLSIVIFANLLIAVLLLPLVPNPSQHNTATAQTSQDEEFVGPFASWANVKNDYHAVGNGLADDTLALQTALNDLGIGEQHPKVLYLPEGTYRITHALIMTSTTGISILGADPDSTIIKWDGPQDGTMLHLNGVRYSRFGRLTWDGSSKALTAVAHKEDGSAATNGVTHNEHADEVFKDVGYGIRAGNFISDTQDAETVVLRSRFVRNSRAGVSIESFNALDWFIWDSSFEDCFIGVTNDPPSPLGGAGNFHVFQSIFRRSTYADITINNTLYFSIRNNFSIGSKAFFIAQPTGRNGAQLTFQGNTILDPQDATPIRISNLGPVLLIDNVIRSAIGQIGPAIQHQSDTGWPGDLVSVGNTFTVNNPIIVNKDSRLRTVDDQVVAHNIVHPDEPVLPGALPNRHRQIFEVLPQADAIAIQHAIDAADQLRGQRPVVHLPSASYRVDHTLIIPAGSDLQLIGVGSENGSILNWTGSDGGTVLRLAGPSHATLRDLQIRGDRGRGNGILVENVDQPDARIFMEQGSVKDTQQVGLLVDGLNHTNVELHDFSHSQNHTVGVKVIGSIFADNRNHVNGRVNIFGGDSGSNTLSYDVVNNGRLMAQDIWYEGGCSEFVRLNDAGTFTLHGARVALPIPPDCTAPAVTIDSFRGNVTFLAIALRWKMVVQGDGKATNVLAMGLQGEYTNDYFANISQHAHAVLLNSRVYIDQSLQVPNQGIAEDAFIRAMLAQTRSEQPRPLTSLPNDVTDIRFYRVSVSQALVGIHLRGLPVQQVSLPLILKE